MAAHRHGLTAIANFVLILHLNCVILIAQLWMALVVTLSVVRSATRWQLRRGWVRILDSRPHWFQDVVRNQVQCIF